MPGLRRIKQMVYKAPTSVEWPTERQTIQYMFLEENREGIPMEKCYNNKQFNLLQDTFQAENVRGLCICLGSRSLSQSRKFP